MKVHQEGRLHRAFSVFVFNDTGGMLIQKRAKNKYHSAGLWTNACCSHPQPDPEEAEAWRWVSPEALQAGTKAHPNRYAYWFKKILTKVLKI